MTRADDLHTLGLGTEASAADIRAAYRVQALHHHPDLGGDATEMAQISDAYQRLIDPAPQPESPPPPPPAPPASTLDPDDLPDNFTIGHAMLAFMVVPVIMTIMLMFGIYAVLSTVL